MIKFFYSSYLFRKRINRLRGAKKLVELNKPFLVVDNMANLTNVHLGLHNDQFPSFLSNSHKDKVEVLLRQVLLKYHTKYCEDIIYAIGKDKPVVSPIPKSWRKKLSENGVQCATFYCQVKLLSLSLKRLIHGFLKSLLFINKSYTFKSLTFPYSVFTNMSEGSLPNLNEDKQFDLISSYKDSKINKNKIKNFCIQVDVSPSYQKPKNLILSKGIFPQYDSFFKYFLFYFRNMAAFFISCLGLIRGKWWYGFIYEESVNLNYIRLLNYKSLAKEYFFNNSSWYYKPLWCFEAESKGVNITLLNYSCNVYKFWRTEMLEPDTYGFKIMSWKRFIVWDKEQESFYKKYCPKAEYFKIGYLNFGGNDYVHNSNKKNKILTIFDVMPWRRIMYANNGYALPTSLPEWSLNFFKDILNVFHDWEILWKYKRKVDYNFIERSFILKRDQLLENKVIKIDHRIAPAALIKQSDLVISMPFTSTSMMANYENIPTAFYDTSGYVKLDKVHGIKILKSKDELLRFSKKFKNT